MSIQSYSMSIPTYANSDPCRFWLEISTNNTIVTGRLHYIYTQEPLDSTIKQELQVEFLNAGVHIDVKPEIEIDEEQRTWTAGSKVPTYGVSKDHRFHKEAK